MIYIFGIVGFLGGFMMGLFIINLFLRNRTRQQLIDDKSLRWTYGVAVWLSAALGCWAGIWTYSSYFY